MPTLFNDPRVLGKLAALAVGVAGVVVSAFAQSGGGFESSFSGYGTIGAVATSTDEAEFRNSALQDRGARRDPDFGVDSRLGLQGRLNWQDTLSLTGQVLASRRNGKDPEVALEWLFGQYNFRPDLDVRVGRMVFPGFMVSDTRNIGFALPGMRAPELVYSQGALTYFDGAQSNWRQPIGEGVLTIQPSWGRRKGGTLYGVDVVPETSVDLKRISALNFQWERGSWLMRAGQIRSNTDVEYVGFPGIYNTKDKFSVFGLQYDNGKALVVSEYIRRRQSGANTLLIDADTAYVTFGWRFGPLMPVLTYSEQRSSAHLFPFTPTDTYKLRSHTISTGARYALARNMAVKAEWLRVDGGDFTLLTNRDPAFNKRHVDVWSIALDFVF